MAGTLEELWVSYNQISTLDGLGACSNLTTLYISNNLIKAWNELDKLVRMGIGMGMIDCLQLFLTCVVLVDNFVQ